MLFSVFSATLSLLSAVTIFHSVVLLTTRGAGIIFIGHVRASHLHTMLAFVPILFL